MLYYPLRPSEIGLESLAGIGTANVSSGVPEGLEVPFHASGKVSAYMLAYAANMRTNAGQIKKVGTLIPTLHCLTTFLFFPIRQVLITPQLFVLTL